MTDDLIKDRRIEAPDVRATFDKAAAKPKEKEAEAPKLELKPPTPSPMGTLQQSRGEQVSRPLTQEETVEKFKKAMLLKREFNRASRDVIER